MTDYELEARLRAALEHAAPDDFEGVRARLTPRTQAAPPPIPLETARRKKPRWLPMAAAACLVLAVAGGGGGWYMVQNNTVASVVSLDVNPSVILDVNAKEKVLSATPVNEDGGDILAGMDLTGVQLDVAMNAIVGSLLTNGYVDELANSILITVEDEDAQRGARLQEELTAQADAILATTSVNGAILSQTIQNSEQLRQLADTYGITPGKAALIQTIVNGSSGLHTFEELVGLSINDLNLLYTSLTTSPAGQTGGETSAQGGTVAQPAAPAIQSSGQASDSAYIGVEAAQAAAYAHAGVDAAQVMLAEVDFDYEDGRMVYELEFYVNGTEYEYDIDANTGAVVKFSREGGWSGQAQGTGTSSGGASGPAAQPGWGSSADIGEQAAQDAAFAQAGVNRSQAENLRTKRDFDDGRLEYEVEFWVGTTEYEYKIDGATGTVLEQEQKTHRSNGNTSDIGEQGALNVALTHAGLSQSQVYELEVKRDYDDGRLEYEVEFKSGPWEYEYVILGADGSILEYERDD